MLVAESTQLLESFLVARWGRDTMLRPHAYTQTGPDGDAGPVETFRGMTWVVFADTSEPKAVGIRQDGSRDGLDRFLLAYLRRSGKLELHRWRRSASGWFHVAER